MLAYLLGIILFALGIAVTIALHEFGHLLAARAFGMRVRRYFIGFGPKVWSFRRGHTEYGINALPFGGFCDIAGMTSQDEVTEEEKPHAMVNKAWWKRVIVLLGGVTVNLALGVALIYGVAVASGIPDPFADKTAVEEFVCVPAPGSEASINPNGDEKNCQAESPAKHAGVRLGDVITGINGHTVLSFPEVRDIILQHPGETVTLSLERSGQSLDVDVDVHAIQSVDGHGSTGVIGVAGPTNLVRGFGPIEAVPASLAFTGETLQATGHALVQFPSMIPGVIESIFGAERAQDSPMSVVGASRVGGELVELSVWSGFFLLLANLNFFLALFNLIPLPPFDGGHIAVIFYEKIRDGIRRLAGKPPAGPADYTKLLPLTAVIAAVFVALGVIFIVADIVNPIRLFG